jgi:DNA (cytosine-5)-methyltransferase 1
MSPRKYTKAQDTTGIQPLREQLGLSQADLASRTGYTIKTIQRWEAGLSTPRRAVFECLRPQQQYDAVGQGRKKFRFVDLFAGIGGLRRGFESIGGECVFTSEWDKYAQQTYRANFRCDHPIAGDIVQIASELIPKHDVLLGGFPCQPFSIAGVSKKNALGRPHGFACDTQGTLFFELARIIQYHKPRAFLLENVKNLASHDGGRTFKTIRRVLTEELHYNISWKIIDGRSVVPQHRERVYIVGFRDDANFSWDALDLPAPEFGPRLKSILHPEDGTEEPESPFTTENGKVASKYTLTPNLWEYLQSYATKHREKGNGFGFGLVGPNDVSRTLSARYYKDGSEILVRRARGGPRRLTPRECARLMGFDRPGIPPMKIEVSDMQAYKQFGNSVVVPVVEAVARAMKPHILGEAVLPRQQLTLGLERSA